MILKKWIGGPLQDLETMKMDVLLNKYKKTSLLGKMLWILKEKCKIGKYKTFAEHTWK